MKNSYYYFVMLVGLATWFVVSPIIGKTLGLAVAIFVSAIFYAGKIMVDTLEQNDEN